MNLLHKERIIVLKETFDAFNRDMESEFIAKTLAKMKMKYMAMIFISFVFFIFANTPQMIVFRILAIAVAGFGVYSGVTVNKKMENNISKALEKGYKDSGYEENYLEIRFYEDKAAYHIGTINDEIDYADVGGFVSEPKYFVMYTTNGISLLMNPTVNQQKIKDIIKDYRTNHQIDVDDVAKLADKSEEKSK